MDWWHKRARLSIMFITIPFYTILFGFYDVQYWDFATRYDYWHVLQVLQMPQSYIPSNGRILVLVSYCDSFYRLCVSSLSTAVRAVQFKHCEFPVEIFQQISMTGILHREALGILKSATVKLPVAHTLNATLMIRLCLAKSGASEDWNQVAYCE